jgi:transposase-like protein
MKAKRKRHSAAFKAKVGFEALVGLKTVSQLAREYAVHPTQVTQWRATKQVSVLTIDTFWSRSCEPGAEKDG